MSNSQTLSERDDSTILFEGIHENTMRKILHAAKTAVRRASLVAVRVREQLNVTDKGSKMDHSPVTVGDYACQVVVMETLRTLLYSSSSSSNTTTSSTNTHGEPISSSSSLTSPLLSTFRMVGEEDAESLKDVSPSIHQRILDILNSSFPRSLLHHHHNSSSSSYSNINTTLSTNVVWTMDHIRDTLSLAGYNGGGSNSYWILDPIDGTKGYLRGGQYAIGLAFVMHGEVVLSVIGCPSLPCPSWSSLPSSSDTGSNGTVPTTLFTAIKGKGATMESLNLETIDTFSPLSTQEHNNDDNSHSSSTMTTVRTITTSPEENVSKLILAESFEKSHSNHDLSAHIGKEIGIVTSPIQLDSMCKYGLLSRGDVHLYLRFPPPNYNEKVWDHAPGSLLCTEAGGIVTDSMGKPLDFSVGRSLSKNYGIVATNTKSVHERILRAIASFEDGTNSNRREE